MIANHQFACVYLQSDDMDPEYWPGLYVQLRRGAVRLGNSVLLVHRRTGRQMIGILAGMSADHWHLRYHNRKPRRLSRHGEWSRPIRIGGWALEAWALEQRAGADIIRTALGR